MSGISPVSRTLPGLAATALLAHALAACNVGEATLANTEAAAEAQIAPLPVHTVRAEVIDLFAQYQATANISADGDAQVPARVTGEVLETLVEEGDRVVQGQLLARIDAERLRLKMLHASASYAQRASEYERQQGLHERGIISNAAFESLQYEVDELKAAYELDRLNYTYSEIRAPISGIVAARNIRPGQFVKNGDLAFRISDTSRLIAELLLPQSELAKFRPGLEAKLTVDAIPGEIYDAKIERISPTIDKLNGTFRATIYVENPRGELAPGMFGRFSVNYAKHEQSLAIPASTVSREDGQTVVYVVKDGIAERLAVQIGIESEGLAQILGGISPGDEIISSGSSGLRDGTRVLASTVIKPPTGV
jgi:membrane fusion protein (multidrug efflux system)